MRRLFWAFNLLGAFCGILLPTVGQTAERLRLVADAWPPFTDSTMVNGGLATELVSTALTRAGYATQFEQVPWARAMLGLEEGRYDVLVNAWFSEDRQKIGEFSKGFLENRIRLLRKVNSSFDYKGDLNTLHLRPVAVVRGYAYSTAFDDDAKIVKVPVHNFSMAVRMVAAERVTFAIEDEYVARYFLMRESSQVRNSVEFIGPPLAQNDLHILVSLKNPEHARIVAAFDKAVAGMRADGTYQRLLKAYGM